MNGFHIILIYFVVVNLIGSLLLYIDKQRAVHNQWRISEKTLHIWELLGGIFSMLPLSYYIRHKNQKASYWLISWSIAITWTALIILLLHQQ